MSRPAVIVKKVLQEVGAAVVLVWIGMVGSGVLGLTIWGNLFVWDKVAGSWGQPSCYTEQAEDKP